jgi:hypothetical protein
MPSPFPGMDPYLENPLYWEDFHDRLIFHIGERLHELLPSNYRADFRRRTSVLLAARDIVPDVAITRRTPEEGSVAILSRPKGGEAILLEVAPTEVYDRYLEIIRVPERTLVAVIEISSPTNKSHPEGRKKYHAKQRSILASDVHLIEIDLLRGGHHWVAAPPDALEAHQPFDYVTCVSRAGNRLRFECYFKTVRQPLSTVEIPLLAPDEDCPLDLQAVFNLAYDQGRMLDDIDYSRPLRPPLSAEDQQWARQLLEESRRV